MVPKSLNDDARISLFVDHFSGSACGEPGSAEVGKWSQNRGHLGEHFLYFRLFAAGCGREGLMSPDRGGGPSEIKGLGVIHNCKHLHTNGLLLLVTCGRPCPTGEGECDALQSVRQ